MRVTCPKFNNHACDIAQQCFRQRLISIKVTYLLFRATYLLYNYRWGLAACSHTQIPFISFASVRQVGSGACSAWWSLKREIWIITPRRGYPGPRGFLALGGAEGRVGGLLDSRRRHIWSKIELFDELDSSKIALNSSTSFALFAILRKRTHHASGVLNWKMCMLRCSNVARRWSNECNTKQHAEMLRDVARKFDENQTRLTGA